MEVRILTVSREMGSGGSPIAERVATILGWHLIDRRLVFALARRLGVPLAEAESRDERVSRLSERVAATLSISLPEFVLGSTPLRPSDRHYRDLTDHIVRRAVEAGPSVVVGHAAQAIFAGRDDAFHVRVYAPFDVRVAQVKQEYLLSDEDATERVRRADADRAAYVKRHYARDWRDPCLYHLQLNTAFYTPDAAADLIVRSVR